MEAFNRRAGAGASNDAACEDARVSIDVRRGADRFVTRAGGITTFHSFSYGAHYDPENVGFGPLAAVNDEHLGPGTGYDEHRHAATDIVTWVLEGRLAHTDSLGNTGTLEAGTLAVAEPGSGVLHSERATPTAPVRFLQMMLRPEAVDGTPSYALGSVPEGPGLHEAVGSGTLPVGVPGARFLAGTLAAGEHPLPDAPLLHVFVVAGSLRLGETGLGPGDTARIVGERQAVVAVVEPVRLGVWAFRG
jgi:redox-sensitive bicupin YhaK (pirin superfamily)